jgi:RNA-directed DNA polymerase
VVNPYFSLWEGEPQGELMEVRAWEDGKSECRPVTGRIGAESVEGKIAPRESAPTSIRSFTTREPDQPTKEKKQMTATQAGAFSHKEVNWDSINWNLANQNVKRLQARIVKATQEGRWGKVKALQRLLTHSFSGKALAVRRVTENQGKRTPGVDQQIWDTPERKSQAIDQLRQHGYKPLPLKRVYIPKDKNRLRPLSIPTMKDRAMQALYLEGLDPIAETTADPNSYGFRKDRSPADAIQQCFNALAQKTSAQWILKCDIKSCFDRISHRWLLENALMDKNILERWLKAGFMDKNVVYLTEAGTPQGGIVSPVLMNLTLNGLERMLKERFSKTERIHCIRFADDILVTGKTRELLETEVKQLIEDFLQLRGLELSTEKTRVAHIEKGVDFLGQNIRKYDGKLLIKPSKKSVKTLLEKVKEVITSNKQTKAGDLIRQLTPIIRGWATYHRHVVSKETFADIDRVIFQRLWRWAKRRHRTKPYKWIKDKYFTTCKGNRWVFYGTIENKDGSNRTVHLLKAASVPIKRHIKIKGEANPYDPIWEEYFERRIDVKMDSTLKGRRQLLTLYKEQGGICPICHQEITEISEWHRHHLIRRTNGGKNIVGNLVLLHPECHRQVHSQGLIVVKLRP